MFMAGRIAADVVKATPEEMSSPASGTSRATGAGTPPPASPARQVFTVYPGPLAQDMVEHVAAFWNAAGADVELVVTTDPNADIAIKPNRDLGGTADGTADMACAVPCRPSGQETITLSSTLDYNVAFVLAHELGHTIGLAHSHTSACSVMIAIGDHCPGNQRPESIPDVDRQALLAIWGPAPAGSR